MSNIDSIKAKLLNIAVQSGKTNEYIQTHYFIERLLYRLSISRYANDFVLKGGLLLHVMFDNRSRATRDIDMLARQISNSPEQMANIFREICDIPVDDGVTFDMRLISNRTNYRRC
jgi:predicted nucleotidyltransferase component of viral defense system